MSVVRARIATADDIPELIRLRGVMIESVRGERDDTWQGRCGSVLEECLADGSMAAVVVDSEHGGLAACGVGLVVQRLPNPGCADGRFGYIQSMCTDERHRRQGHARRVLEGLLTWFSERGVTQVDLQASTMGEPLYRSQGFTDPHEPLLRWRMNLTNGQ
jgi:GNAT superfamily N-acetyltransferase